MNAVEQKDQWIRDADLCRACRRILCELSLVRKDNLECLWSVGHESENSARWCLLKSLPMSQDGVRQRRGISGLFCDEVDLNQSISLLVSSVGNSYEEAFYVRRCIADLSEVRTIRKFLAGQAGFNRLQRPRLRYSIPSQVDEECMVHLKSHGCNVDVVTNPHMRDTTASPGVFARLSQWLNNCRQSHRDCSPRSEIVYPTRLIDVNAASSSSVQLITTEYIEIQGAYCTLSHCWGQGVTYRLLQENIHSLHKGIHIENLSLTFQHAIDVARRLQIRYLWIDAMCIIQDDASDWHREAPIMAEVYSNAVCCIAATWTAQSEGLYTPRVLSTRLRCHSSQFLSELTFTSLPGLQNSQDKGELDYQTYFATKSPLNKRAWVLQERLLSQRVIHFAEGQVFWQCAHGIASDQIEAMSLSRHLDSRLLLGRNGVSTHGQLSNWMKICEDHSTLRVSFQTDRLASLAGLASVFSKSFDDQYVAGHWTKYLPVTLCWQVTRSCRNERNTEVPSFSWFSVSSPVEWDHWLESQLDPLHFLVRIEVQTRRPISNALIDDQAGTRLNIRGRLRKFTKAAGRFGEHGEFRVLEKDETESEPLYSRSNLVIYRDCEKPLETTTCRILALVERDIYRPSGIFGIIVKPKTIGSPLYIRVAAFNIELRGMTDSESQNFVDDMKSTPLQEITLV